jgi:hypothetical protein
MIGAMARHRVQVLRAGGKTLRRIAVETGIPPRSVKRIVRESPITGRPSLVARYREQIGGVLAAEPTLPTVEILHRVRELGYAGAKTALYEAVRRLRGRRTVGSSWPRRRSCPGSAATLRRACRPDQGWG